MKNAGSHRRLSGPLTGRTIVAGLGMILTMLLVPSQVEGQGMSEILEVVRQGGAWVNIPIEGGRGTVETVTVPAAGAVLQGCARVWRGHTGTWVLRAEDLVGGEVVMETLRPDQPVRFNQELGARVKLALDVRWSEPRDTTLFLWVGLGSEERDRNACDPVADE